MVRLKFKELFNIIILHLFRILPVNKCKIVFLSYNGMGYGDNPKFIAEEIIKQEYRYDLVWIVKNMDDVLPDSIRKVRWGSLQAKYELFTAKIIINNCKSNPHHEKKRSQYYIQTWHGGFPMKYIEKEIELTLDSWYVALSKSDSAVTDLMLSSDSLLSGIMKDFFWYNGEILEKGIPRNDLYFNATQDDIRAVKKKYKFPLGKKIMVYAPTFRDDNRIDVYSLDVESVLKELERLTRDEWIGLIRLHPNVYNQDSVFCFSEKVLNASRYPDPQEIFLVSDFCITDYSSLMADFVMMKKPVIRYAPDYDDYIKTRPLRPIYQDLPFPICYSNQEVINTIRNFDSLSYERKVSAYFSRNVHFFDSGHASEEVVSRISDVINGKFKFEGKVM